MRGGWGIEMLGGREGRGEEESKGGRETLRIPAGN